jgi:prepilin-type processing-associated H-X9-DG protein
MSAARIHKRLARLENAVGANREPSRPANVLFLDGQDRILFDGNEAMRSWAGRHRSEWPAAWWDQPWPITLVGGVDPLVVFGLPKDGGA